MRVVVTGATGFVGRYIVSRLAAEGMPVRGLWHQSPPSAAIAGVEWTAGDFGNAARMVEVLQGAEAIVHTAFDFRFLADRPPALAEANLIGSLRFIEAARAANIDRIIVISSTAAIGGRHEPSGRPATHYGAVKASIEAFVASYGLGERWPICALRPPAVYGIDQPIERSPYFRLVAAALTRAPDGVEGDDVIHAADLALAVTSLLRADSEMIAGQVYPCGDLSVPDAAVARLARAAAGLEPDPPQGFLGPAACQRGPGPLNQLAFGGEHLLRETVRQLVIAVREKGNGTSTSVAELDRDGPPPASSW